MQKKNIVKTFFHFKTPACIGDYNYVIFSIINNEMIPSLFPFHHP